MTIFTPVEGYYLSCLSYRKLSLEDLRWFLEVRNSARFSLHDNRLFTYEECLNWFQAGHANHYVVRFNELKLGYFRYRNAVNPGVYEIGLDLDSSIRGLKISKILYFDFSLKVAKRTGCLQLQLRVLKTNRIAVALYKSMSFDFLEESPHDYLMACCIEDLVNNLQIAIKPKNLEILLNRTN